MEELIEKLGWKKVAVALILISVVALIFLFISFANMDKNIASKKVGEASVNSNENTNREITNAPKNNQATVLSKTYITPYYQISYPEDYEAILYTASNGILSNLKIKDKETDSLIEIVVFPLSSNSVVKFSEPYENAKNYMKKELTNGSLSGVEYVGGLNSVKSRELVALFQKESGIIRVQLSYGGDINKSLENRFDEILKSLQ